MSKPQQKRKNAHVDKRKKKKTAIEILSDDDKSEPTDPLSNHHASKPTETKSVAIKSLDRIFKKQLPSPGPTGTKTVLRFKYNCAVNTVDYKKLCFLVGRRRVYSNIKPAFGDGLLFEENDMFTRANFQITPQFIQYTENKNDAKIHVDSLTHNDIAGLVSLMIMAGAPSGLQVSLDKPPDTPIAKRDSSSVIWTEYKTALYSWETIKDKCCRHGGHLGSFFNTEWVTMIHPYSLSKVSAPMFPGLFVSSQVVDFTLFPDGKVSIKTTACEFHNSLVEKLKIRQWISRLMAMQLSDDKPIISQEFILNGLDLASLMKFYMKQGLDPLLPGGPQVLVKRPIGGYSALVLIAMSGKAVYTFEDVTDSQRIVHIGKALEAAIQEDVNRSQGKQTLESPFCSALLEALVQTADTKKELGRLRDATAATLTERINQAQSNSSLLVDVLVQREGDEKELKQLRDKVTELNLKLMDYTRISMEKSNPSLLECVACLHQNRSVLFLDCQHVAFCYECFQTLQRSTSSPTCPLCRGDANNHVVFKLV